MAMTFAVAAPQLVTSRCEGTTSTGLRAVLFTDIVDSAEKQARLGDRGWRDLLMAHRRAVRASVLRWRGFENDTAGDGFYITFARPTEAVFCALEITADAPALALQVRAGLHYGTCELADDKCSGLAVSIGARVAALARGGEVLATEAVRAGARDESLHFAAGGMYRLKGIAGRWRLYRVATTRPSLSSPNLPAQRAAATALEERAVR